MKIKEVFDASMMDKNITLSMGVCLFDRERPLGAAIQKARDALAISKNLKTGDRKKDGLTIAIQTASGNVFSATAHWGNDWRRISNAIKLINGDSKIQYRLSMGWAYEVESYLEGLPPDQWGEESFRNAVRDEVKRITFRKLIFGKAINEKEDIMTQDQTEKPNNNKTKKAEMNNNIWNDELFGVEWFTKGLKREIAEQLHLIAFLARESGLKTIEATEKTTGGEE